MYQEGKIGSTRRELEEWIRTMPQPRTIAMEATIFTGWIYDHLLPHAEKVKVAHPLMLRAIAAAKKKGETCKMLVCNSRSSVLAYKPSVSVSNPLCTAFGSIKVNRITVEMVRTYMADRTAANVANKTINLELGVLRSVLKRAKLWHLFMDEIKPLPVRSQIGRAMTLDEKLRLAKVAAMKPTSGKTHDWLWC